MRRIDANSCEVMDVPQQKLRRKRNGPDSRATLLTTAGSLFARSGFHQVSVDDIADTAQVAKTAIYYHFGNKEGLVTDFLEGHIETLEASLIEAVSAHTKPRARLRAVFDWHTSWFRQPDFAGCVFSRATEEYKGKQDAIVEISRLQKRSLRHAIRALLEADGVLEERSEQLAHFMIYLLDGAVVSANVLDEKDAADQAWVAAERLLDDETRRHPPTKN
ncbi:TetR/AcrR family transcriptional regulator [Acetobacter sp. DmW_125133]|uniref:TetR/AcrR family transcriptional regulator n=4 Tax=Acetobacter TaxID=434 RepID=A0A291PJX3_9PROT|nr:TetR/AcrR family transcriptional regulator [Acetobacter sicerae]ASL40978.1 TetR family transcriptional regulator [Acetobacter oryzifermentans]ATJ91697.1 TetR/AcrR family transcriptional regulator [Acetobacter tropicalis]KAA8386538.1 TetR/AcrR family transcriptional regulator [Acetobacter sp. DmW_136]KAA8396073.1 TetR/AcrR family transcriptional regulator [Acetobacter sp. DmW_125124]KAA8396427.1 TetR/AcrR family transcriptional regulator [Acetobacter sp. DmW_125127]KAA8398513.1 TetR/AcrR fa